MDRVAALVLAGGKGGDFGALSEHRTKAAFPVGGDYRIIDFPLSNLCHAGIRQVGVIIQYMPSSLMEHIGSGRPWEFDMADRCLRFMTPFVGVDEIRWFHGTGDAIAKNINLLNIPDQDDVLILSGEHVYRMDYRKLINHHRATHADVTFSCVAIPPEQQNPRFGNIVAGEGGRVEAFIEKPEHPVSSLVSMGIYCFRREVLMDLLQTHMATGLRNDFSLASDILQPYVGRMNTQAWIFNQPWHYLADLREYYDFHMQLAGGQLNFFDPSWDVITNFSDRNLSSRPPAFMARSSEVDASLISSGAWIEGRVTQSVLSPGVSVGEGSVIRNSVIFHDVKIGRNCRVENAVIDKDVVLEDGAQVGVPAETFTVRSSPSPITVIPKTYRVARGEVISAGAVLESTVMI